MFIILLGIYLAVELLGHMVMYLRFCLSLSYSIYPSLHIFYIILHTICFIVYCIQYLSFCLPIVECKLFEGREIFCFVTEYLKGLAR